VQVVVTDQIQDLIHTKEDLLGVEIEVVIATEVISSLDYGQPPLTDPTVIRTGTKL